MSWNNQYQQNNIINNTSYPQKTRSKKLMFALIIFGVVVCVVFILFVFNKGATNNSIDIAKTAARKEIPNAEVKQVVVADDFAMAIVYVPKDKSQLGSGNTAIFKINQDGSMTYITSASDFSPIDLLELGIPLVTQAKLYETNIDNIKETLANDCGFSGHGNIPGFSGFDSSFNPDGWQLDSASLDRLNQALETVMESNNKGKVYDDMIVCINAPIKGSDIKLDKTTYVSTFVLKLQFITGNGALTDHELTFTDEPIYSRVYTLDGQKIKIK